MTAQWITAEFDLQAVPEKLYQEINSKLTQIGEVFCWIVTDVDKQHQKIHVDAIVHVKDADR